MVDQDKLEYIWRLDATVEGYEAFIDALPDGHKPDSMIQGVNKKFLGSPEHKTRVKQLRRILKTKDIDVGTYKYYLSFGRLPDWK